MLNLFMMQKNEKMKKKKKAPFLTHSKIVKWWHGNVCTYFAHFVGMLQENNRAFPRAFPWPWGMG
jgi:hypothetical protein